jgi:UDP-glucose 4-epimerase
MIAPTAILDDNIKATHNLLHWCKEGTHFLFASSIVVYGNSVSYAISTQDYTEEHVKWQTDWVEPVTEDATCNPTSLYGITKLASEHLIKAYSEYRGIKYKILRLCATVGPGLSHGILYDFIRKVKTEETLTMLGDCPGSCKPYLHVDDVVSAFTLLLNEKRDAVLNICSRWSITVDEIADIVMEELGISKEKIWAGAGANWKGDNPHLAANPDRATHFGWDRELDSVEAMRKAVRENV